MLELTRRGTTILTTYSVPLSLFVRAIVSLNFLLKLFPWQRPKIKLHVRRTNLCFLPACRAKLSTGNPLTKKAKTYHSLQKKN